MINADGEDGIVMTSTRGLHTLRSGACACTALLILLLAVGAANSRADDYMTVPGGAIKQVTAKPHLGGGVTPFATQQSGLFACSVSWATIANEPDGYAIGNCNLNQTLYRTWKSDLTAHGYFDGGYMDGPGYASCGWVNSNQDYLYANQGNTSCVSSASHGIGEFVAPFQGGWYMNCQPGSCTDGSPATNYGACTEYANYRPFSSSPSPSYALRTVPDHATWGAGPRLLWRYLTRTTYGGHYYYMVRDQAIAAGSGNWVFVVDTCLGGHA